MTADGARRAETWRTKAAANYAHAGPEDLRPYDRCISRGVLGSQFPNIYASAYWILQTPGQVVIHHEMVHETRVIPLDGRPHIAAGIRQWMGDSRGRWDGDTLVVETANSNGRTGSYARNGNGNPTSEALRLVERFRLADSGTLDYEVRIEDPLTWTQAVDGGVPAGARCGLPPLRVRLPRGELRRSEHPERRARGRAPRDAVGPRPGRHEAAGATARPGPLPGAPRPACSSSSSCPRGSRSRRSGS